MIFIIRKYLTVIISVLLWTTVAHTISTPLRYGVVNVSAPSRFTRMSVSTDNLNMSNWMFELPEKYKSMPLNHLAIPGSHNSFTYSLKLTSVPSPDEYAYDIVKHLPSEIGGPLIHAWCVTQDTDLHIQLNSGIRYLDFRVVNRNNEFWLAHGQYAKPIFEELPNILQFLKDHPKEIIIIDMNHCYEFDTIAQRDELQSGILKILGPVLFPFQDTIPSLNDMYAKKQQIIFLNCLGTWDFSIDRRFWPVRSIHSLWPNTDSPEKLIQYLDEHYGPDFHRVANRFYVHQGILTPSKSYIIDHLTGSLRGLSKMAGKFYLPWLTSPNRKAGPDGINIALLDFCNTEFPDYANAVIQLNFRIE